MLLYSLYQIVVTILFVLTFPFVFILNCLGGGAPQGLAQRIGIGFRCPSKNDTGSVRIWIHASSVGEVQAAKVLIQKLKDQKKKFEFFLSTMTEQGQNVARNQLSSDVFCFLAPLDISYVVRRFLATVGPDLYVCMETELWPAMFIEVKRFEIPAIVLNGRMTPGSFRSYKRIRGLMHFVLGNLTGVAVISDEDGKRFKQLGVPAEVLQVTGNIKYDYSAEAVGEARRVNRDILQAGEATVFICGSTRPGEEEILLGVYNTLQKRSGNRIIWVIAPRHLDRLADVQKVLTGSNLGFDLFSELKNKGRSHSVVLVDTIGDLSYLYSAGDFNFVGGSLVNQRGHNIMEAARWGKPVYYGPSIDDFKDAAEILENAGGAFKVTDGNELAVLLIDHLQNREKFTKACVNAAHAVSLQRGAAARQADIVLNAVAGHGHSPKQMS